MLNNYKADLPQKMNAEQTKLTSPDTATMKDVGKVGLVRGAEDVWLVVPPVTAPVIRWVDAPEVRL